MADLSAYSTEDPAFYDFFGGASGIYDVIRKLKIAFEERFALDHYFDVDLTTTDPECDGYHKSVIMKPFVGISSTTGQEILDPEEISDGVRLYCKTIDGKPELCFRDQDGCFQMTDDTIIASGFKLEAFYSTGASIRTCISAKNIILFGCYQKIVLFDGTNFTTVLTGGGHWNVFYNETLDLFLATSNDLVYTSPDGSAWTLRSSYSGYVFSSYAYSDNVIVGVGYFSGSNVAATIYSTDGITWTRELYQSSVYTGRFYEVVYDSFSGNFHTCGTLTNSGNAYSVIGKRSKSNIANTWVLTLSLSDSIFTHIATDNAGNLVAIRSSDPISQVFYSLNGGDTWNRIGYNWSMQVMGLVLKYVDRFGYFFIGSRAVNSSESYFFVVKISPADISMRIFLEAPTPTNGLHGIIDCGDKYGLLLTYSYHNFLVRSMSSISSDNVNTIIRRVWCGTSGGFDNYLYLGCDDGVIYISKYREI